MIGLKKYKSHWIYNASFYFVQTESLAQILAQMITNELQ